MYYFIVNPASGSGRGLSVWKTIEAELKRLGTDYRAFLLSRPGEAQQLVSGFASRKSPCTIVAVGGDGTINDIMNGLESFEHITFACIPTGSGNDFVRGMSLCKNPVEALHIILHPKEIQEINVGRSTVQDQQNTTSFSFAVSSGLGYDAAVCDSVQKSGLKKVLNLFHAGKVVYLLTALWQLFTMPRSIMEIIVDDETTYQFQRTYFAAAMNLRFEGGGFDFCPEALSGDDYLDLIIVNNISRLRALTLLPLALKGKHVGKNGIHIIRCQKAVLKNSEKVCVHTDGEVCGFYDNIIYEMRNEKLAVIVR